MPCLIWSLLISSWLFPLLGVEYRLLPTDQYVYMHICMYVCMYVCMWECVRTCGFMGEWEVRCVAYLINANLRRTYLAKLITRTNVKLMAASGPQSDSSFEYLTTFTSPQPIFIRSQLFRPFKGYI